MSTQHPQAVKALDAKHNASARLEVVARGRSRSASETLEAGLALQSAALEFAQAFAAERPRPEG